MIGNYSLKEAEQLIKYARKCIEHQLNCNSSNSNEQEPKLENKKEFNQARGVFVTLNSFPQKQLRGCIGFPLPTFSIREVVKEASLSAAFSDPRFKPITKDELKNITIELSILTIPYKTNPKEIMVGKDGLIIECFGYSGLLLPQVAKEYNLSKIQFLEAVCQKAGLPKDTWEKDKAVIKKFQAQIFKEESPNGRITEEK
jgi:hypothetical protein